VPAEHADEYRARRIVNPKATSELLRREVGPTWARQSIAARLDAVNRWLADHKPGALLELDIRAQKRSGGIVG
jgi:hypothetical protein